MPDPFESEVNYPPHQKSRETEQKLFSFRGQFEDDNCVMFDYFFKGWYEEDGSDIRIIEHTFMHKTTANNPTFRKNYGDAIIGKETIRQIITPAIQDYLKITGTIHFDSKLEI